MGLYPIIIGRKLIVYKKVNSIARCSKIPIIILTIVNNCITFLTDVTNIEIEAYFQIVILGL